MSNHKVFVSYKYSDGCDLKDKIMTKLGNQGHIYKGEKSYQKLEVADNTIKEYLKDMIFDSSVTVVVISPEVIQSSWVDWEIRYSLTYTSRGGKSSKRNGIVCVIQNKIAFSRIGGFVYNTNWSRDYYGHLKQNIFPPSIINNLQNTFGNRGKILEEMGSNDDYHDANDYCVVVAEDTFLRNPNKYIDIAYERAMDTTNYPIKVRGWYE